jgi:hypothetical protein
MTEQLYYTQQDAKPENKSRIVSCILSQLTLVLCFVQTCSTIKISDMMFMFISLLIQTDVTRISTCRSYENTEYK